MKTRKGFVSNSSSSSFIVARAQVGDEKFEKVVQLCKDNGDYPEISGGGNYLFVDMSESGFDEEILTEIGVGPNDYFMRYE